MLFTKIFAYICTCNDLHTVKGKEFHNIYNTLGGKNE